MADGRPIYRVVSPLFWDDPDVRALTALDQYLALHILTCRQTSGSGLFRFSLATAKEDLAKVAGSLSERFAKVSVRLNWAFHEPSKTLYLPTWWKWNPPDSPNHLRGAMKSLVNLPQTPLLYDFASNTEWLVASLHETFGKACQSLMVRLPTQEQEQELDHEHDQEPDNDHDKPPQVAANDGPVKPKPVDPTEEVFAKWNATPGVRKVRGRDEDRRKLIRKRLKDPEWGWEEALACFPLKWKGTDGTWLPDLDWFLKEKTVRNILEGKLDKEKDNGRAAKDKSRKLDEAERSAVGELLLKQLGRLPAGEAEIPSHYEGHVMLKESGWYEDHPEHKW